MINYIIKQIIPSSEYEGIVFTQNIQILNPDTNSTIWVEDNHLLIKPEMLHLPDHLKLRASSNGFYKNESMIPLDKKSFTVKALVIDENSVYINTFEYKTGEKLIGFKNGDSVWLSVYLKDVIEAGVS